VRKSKWGRRRGEGLNEREKGERGIEKEKDSELGEIHGHI
jgi:hypothetical protein